MSATLFSQRIVIQLHQEQNGLEEKKKPRMI